MKRICLMMTLVCMMMVSCRLKVEKATVIVKEITDITTTSVKVICEVTDDGGTDVTSRGICWTITKDSDNDCNNDVKVGGGIGGYDYEIKELEPDMTYYVWAYAVNGEGKSESEKVAVTTITDKINGYKYVDLGLPSGLKWAAYNIGANTPEEFGDYFAWGETDSKTEYTEENSVTYGVQIKDIGGDAEYDAATAIWGSPWKMPSNEDVQELIDNCEWEWTQINGIYGVKVIGLNDNNIFLPAAGNIEGTSHLLVGGQGYYWTSLPYYEYMARSLYFGSNREGISTDTRFAGLSIRPVSE